MTATNLYVDRDSPLHKLTGRAKLALASSVALSATIFNAPFPIFVLLTVSFITLVSVGGYRNLVRVWHIIIALMTIGLVVWPAFIPAEGPVLINQPPIRLSLNELQLAVARSSRIATYIILGLTFITTTSNEQLVSELRALGLPFVVCFVLATSLRLFPTFIGTVNNVRDAQLARGHDITSRNPIKWMKNHVPFLVPVFIISFRNVKTQSMALEARGFSPGKRRTFYNKKQLHLIDWISVIVSILIVLFTIFLTSRGVGVL